MRALRALAWCAATSNGVIEGVYFGLTKAIPLMVKQREDLDAVLRAEGSDPEQVGILGVVAHLCKK
jgi:hypothetical protein